MLSMAQFFRLLMLLSSSILFVSGTSNFTLMNNCTFTVWPGAFSVNVVTIPTTGFVLEKGESKSFLAPSDWNGNVWGRTNCRENSTGYFSCRTGDCGSGKLECSGGNTSFASKVVIGTTAYNGQNYYYISLVDGYNLPIMVAPQNGSGPKCTNTICSMDLDKCPSQLQYYSFIPYNHRAADACQSPCRALGNSYCCDGDVNSPACGPTEFSKFFKEACPTAARNYNDHDFTNNTFSCAAGSDYVITFCPSPINSTDPAAPSPSPVIPDSSPALPPTPRSPSAEGPSVGSAGNGGHPAAVIVAIVLVTIFAIILATMAFCLLRRKAKKNNNLTMETTGGNEISEAKSLQYDLSYIKAATKNFSADHKIGEGGFGEVFKATLNNGQQVAVKRLSQSSGQGEQEFKNEVLVVAKLQHRNLVRLLGYCLEKEERILIYEYVPNESLDFILFDQGKQQLLDWSRRYKIIGGAARGILYLHEDSRLRIIHRDIKASNVLLDKDMNAKICDFGSARIVGYDESEGSTNRVVGTFGYMSPEYIMHGQFSIKSDVFSFGVLVLEIISGKKNNKFYQSSEHLLSYAWKLWRDGKPLELVDPALGDSFNENDVTRCIHIGLLCVQENLDERPTMASVVHMLNSSSMTLQIPHEPAFFLEDETMPISNLPGTVIWSVNGVSISELCPR